MSCGSDPDPANALTAVGAVADDRGRGYPTDGGEARKVAVSVGSQALARIVHFALNVVSTLAIIRYMTPAGYGEFVLILTVVTMARLISDFGLNQIAVREAARETATEAQIIGTVIVMRLVLSVVAMTVIQVALISFRASDEVKLAGFVASLLLVAESLASVVIAFQVRVRQQYEALVLVVAETVETALILWLVSRNASLATIVAAPVVGMLVGAGLASFFVLRRFRVRLHVERRLVGTLLREAFPVAVAGLVGVIVFKTDSVMLAALRPTADLGIYGAAFQPVEYLGVASVVLITVPLPLLSRYHGSDPLRFRAATQMGAELILVGLTPLCVILAIGATPLVRAFYGPDFSDAALPLRPLALALLIMIVTAWYVHVLLAAGHQRVTVRYNIVGLACAIALNALLIPRYGYMGAAYSTVGTVVVVLGLVLRAAGRLAGVNISWSRGVRILIANGLVALLLEWALRTGFTLWFAGPLAITAYVMSLQALKVTDLRASVRALVSDSGTGNA